MSNMITAKITKQPSSPLRFRYPSEFSSIVQPHWQNTLLDQKEANIEVQLYMGNGTIYRHPDDITVKAGLVNAHTEEDGTYLPHIYTLHGPHCVKGYYEVKCPGNQQIRIPPLQVVIIKKKDEITYRKNLQSCIDSNRDLENKLPALLGLPFRDLKQKFSLAVRYCVQIELTGYAPICAYTDPIDCLKNSDEYKINRLIGKKRKPEVDQILKKEICRKKKAGSGVSYNIHLSDLPLQPAETPELDLPYNPPTETQKADPPYHPPTETQKTNLPYNPPSETEKTDLSDHLPAETEKTDLSDHLPAGTEKTDLSDHPPTETQKTDLPYLLAETPETGLSYLLAQTSKTDLPCNPSTESPMISGAQQSLPHKGGNSSKTNDDVNYISDQLGKDDSYNMTDEPNADYYIREFILDPFLSLDTPLQNLDECSLPSSPTPLPPPQYMEDKSIELPPEFPPPEFLE